MCTVVVKSLEDAKVAQPLSIDTQARALLVAGEKLRRREQSRSEKARTIFGEMAAVRWRGPGQVLMSIAQHGEFPVQPCGDLRGGFQEQEIARTKIAVY